MKIPVGYLNKPVYKVKAGDVIHIHGEVLDVYETERRLFRDEDTGEEYIASSVVLVFYSNDLEEEMKFIPFSHMQKVRVLRYAKPKKQEPFRGKQPIKVVYSSKQQSKVEFFR